MSGRPFADGHGGSTAERCGSTRPSSRDTANSATSSGKTGEVSAASWLRDIGVLLVEHPGTAGFDDSGRGIEPDLGLLLGTGGPAVTMLGMRVDAWAEVKHQDGAGSVLDKFEYAIRRYGALSDATGIPSVLFYELDVSAATAAELAYYQRLADAHLVGFVAHGSVDAAELRALLGQLVRRRTERLVADAEADRLLSALGPQVVAQLYRRSLQVREHPELSAFDALLV